MANRDDANQAAARIVRESTADKIELPRDAEAAWEHWIAGIQQVDERAKTLLRAAFEAGVSAAAQSAPDRP